jgi:hypothetical protein
VIDMFEKIAVDAASLEVAIDGLVDRFGVNVVQRAEDLDKPGGMPRIMPNPAFSTISRLAPTLDYLDQK